ncbi:MAG: hypothetical protein ACO204_05350 [Schleiferiaceae bacterium]
MAYDSTAWVNEPDFVLQFPFDRVESHPARTRVWSEDQVVISLS